MLIYYNQRQIVLTPVAPLRPQYKCILLYNHLLHPDPGICEYFFVYSTSAAVVVVAVAAATAGATAGFSPAFFIKYWYFSRFMGVL
jgi:hypothetical protein